MDKQQTELLASIHALADSVQRDTGRYCCVSTRHHPGGVLHVRASINDYDPDAGEPEAFAVWDTALDGISVITVRDELAYWLAERRRERAA